MKKYYIAGAILVILLVGVGFATGMFSQDASNNVENKGNMSEDERMTNDLEGVSSVTPGTYQVVTEESEIGWAGTKPFIDGYKNTGTIPVSGGEITVSEAGDIDGSLEFNMRDLRVTLTPLKPGSEEQLRGHLRSSDWFNVDIYPSAMFVASAITRVEGSETNYTVTGDLTIKDITNEVVFPARIYETADGTVRVEGTAEVDRTKWNLQFGSGSFVDNLGDNLISDTAELSFEIAATPGE